MHTPSPLGSQVTIVAVATPAAQAQDYTNIAASGRVTAQDGAPIADAEIKITYPSSTDPDQIYVLQASPEMHTWTSISTNLTDASGLKNSSLA